MPSGLLFQGLAPRRNWIVLELSPEIILTAGEGYLLKAYGYLTVIESQSSSKKNASWLQAEVQNTSNKVTESVYNNYMRPCCYYTLEYSLDMEGTDGSGQILTVAWHRDTIHMDCCTSPWQKFFGVQLSGGRQNSTPPAAGCRVDAPVQEYTA